MKTVCDLNKCVGCHACEELCPKAAIKISDSLENMNAVIDKDLCIECGICSKVCQVIEPIDKYEPIKWYQGWSENENVRRTSSSGGMAAELSKTILKSGGVVCSCVFENGKFIFKLTDSMEQAKKFAGSKYVKSDASGIYKEIKKHLNKDETVLFIGLPCQCAGVKKAVSNIKKGELYTADLICHGTPSPKVLNTFLNQYKMNLENVETLSFRDKGRFSLRVNEKYIIAQKTMDCYSIAFLNGLSYTENCYECAYADSKRITDITIGDSWGTELADSGKGVSLILCNTEKGKLLAESSNVYLTDADRERSIATNPQLSAPTFKPEKREAFFNALRKGKPFNAAVMTCCTNKWFRQFVKRQLIRLKLVG